MALARFDAFLRKRSTAAWVAFRAVSGFLLLGGFASWVALWYERHPALGISQALLCGLVLAHELGLLTRRTGLR